MVCEYGFMIMYFIQSCRNVINGLKVLYKQVQLVLDFVIMVFSLV